MLINWNWIETGYPLSSKGAARGKKSETTAKTHLDANLQNKWALHINARIVPNQIVTDAETDICWTDRHEPPIGARISGQIVKLSSMLRQIYGGRTATNWCRDIRSGIIISGRTGENFSPVFGAKFGQNKQSGETFLPEVFPRFE